MEANDKGKVNILRGLHGIFKDSVSMNVMQGW